MQGPGGPTEDPTHGFDLGGWTATFWDDTNDDAMSEAMADTMSPKDGKTYDLLLGRKTYDIFAAHWPALDGDPTADHLNTQQKWVRSRTRTEATWSNTTILRGDAGETVAALKATDGPDLMVHGSSDLIQTLLRHGLVDELAVWTFPVLLGSGKRLFGEGTRAAGLRLMSSATSGTGVVITRYEVAGEVPIGSFQLEEPTEAELERRELLV